MPLPSLRSNGTLPPGTYHATLDEVFTAFPPVSAQRLALNQALLRGVETVKQLHLADHIVLDGSYLTSKPDPEDIDVVVLTPGLYQLAGESRFAAEGIDITLLDIQFAHDMATFQGWITFFSTARNASFKGVVWLDY